MEDKGNSESKKTSCCPLVEVSKDGSFKLSGPESFINEKYKELIGIHDRITKEEEAKKKELRKCRNRIFWYLILLAATFPILIIIAVIFFNEFLLGKLVIASNKLLLIFSASLLGLAIRVKHIGKDIKIDKSVNDLKTGYIIHAIIVFAASFLILSVFSQLGYEGWRIYSATLPLGFFAGILGVSVVDKVRI